MTAHNLIVREKVYQTGHIRRADIPPLWFDKGPLLKRMLAWWSAWVYQDGPERKMTLVKDFTKEGE